MLCLLDLLNVRVSGRCWWRTGGALLGKSGVAARFGMSRQALAENVGYGRQSVAGMVCWDMVDVRCAGHLRRLVGDVTGKRLRVVHSGKGLAEGSGLDHTLMGKLFM